MFSKLTFCVFFLQFYFFSSAFTHCQMPCGIYHDQIVFDQMEQYIETLAKGLSVLNEIKEETPQMINQGTRWVLLKESSSDEMAHLILTYFLQQKIKPNTPQTEKQLVATHHLLLLLVKIKQGVEIKTLSEFYNQWEKFKELFLNTPTPPKSDIDNLKKILNSNHSH